MSNWKHYNLIDVADVKLSNVDKKTKTNERTVHLCNYTDVYKNHFINKVLTNNFMIATCSENDYKKFNLKEGQVAITKDSEKADDIGVSTFISESLPNVVLGYHLSLITPNKDQLDGRFLHFWFNTKHAKRYFENNASGSGQRYSLNLDTIKSIPLLLPEISVQQQIAKVLSDLDAKIEVNNQINRELEAMAKLVYDYWFVQFDFPNKDGMPYKSSGGKMVYNEALKREIPEGGEVKSLFDVSKVQYGYPFSTNFFNEIGNGIPVIRIRDILDNSISNYSTEENVDEKYLINKGDLLIGMDGNFHINYWSFEGCYLNQRVVKISETLLPNIYLKYQVEPYIKLREKSVSRTTVGHLSDKDLKAVKIILPNIEITKLINTLFNKTLNKIIQVKNENQQLAALRDWLLPMLMNGQASVSKAYKEGSEEMGMAAEGGEGYKINNNS